MKKSFALALLTIAILLLFAIPVLAGSMSVSGTLDTSDANSGDCPTHYQDAYPITVTVTGTYSLSGFSPTTTNFDANFFYAHVNTSPGPDNSTAALSSPIFRNNMGDGFDGVLTSGVSYYLHVSGSAGCHTVFPLSYSVTLSGLGEIVGIGGTSEEVTVEVQLDDTVYPPDERINWQHGDLSAILYRSSNSDGEPAIDVYCWDGTNSWLGMRVDESTPYGTSANGCDVTFYIGDDGVYQFNINFDGKLYEIRCEDMACFEREMSYYDPNE